MGIRWRLQVLVLDIVFYLLTMISLLFASFLVFER